jgi:hypothetical protein
MSDPNAVSAEVTQKNLLDLFRFYEDDAERAKSHAWAQSTWSLALNAALLAFSINLYVEHPTIRGFLLLEAFAAAAGLVLCWYALFVLRELGEHIQGYWTAANRIAGDIPLLLAYIGVADTEALRDPKYKAKYPPFIERLRMPILLFAGGHVAWFVVVALAIAGA